MFEPKSECEEGTCECGIYPEVKYHPSIAANMDKHNTLAEMIASNLQKEHITDVEEGVRRLIITRQLNHDN
jgi:hypothetical protein